MSDKIDRPVINYISAHGMRDAQRTGDTSGSTSEGASSFRSSEILNSANSSSGAMYGYDWNREPFGASERSNDGDARSDGRQRVFQTPSAGTRTVAGTDDTTASDGEDFDTVERSDDGDARSDGRQRVFQTPSAGTRTVVGTDDTTASDGEDFDTVEGSDDGDARSDGRQRVFYRPSDGSTTVFIDVSTDDFEDVSLGSDNSRSFGEIDEDPDIGEIDEGWDIEKGLPPASDAGQAQPSTAGGGVFSWSPQFSALSTCPGPGGCCLTFAGARQAIGAGLVQGVSTALTFGTKPLVEAAVVMLLPATAPAWVGVLVPVIAGSVYVGAVHSTFGRVASGLLNSTFGLNTYSNKGGGIEALLGEVGTIDAPVMAAFVAGYAVRGATASNIDNIWALAFSKSVTSTASGLFQGAVTDALRQTLVAYKKVYREEPPKDLSGERLEFVKDTFKDVWNVKAKEKFFHDVVGKIAGASLGGILATYAGGDPAQKGAGGLALFLTGWFSGIHTGQFTGKLLDDTV